MGEITDVVLRFFQEDGWPVSAAEGATAFKIAYEGENGQWVCHAQAREEYAQFVFYSIFPSNTPERSRLAMAEFLARVNAGMVAGNFELDMDDGEVRYKTSIDVEGDRLSAALVKRLVYINLIMMDKYLPGIMAVSSGMVTPAAALAQIERPSQAQQ